jgi:putative transposase
MAERAIKECRVSLLLVLEMSRVSQACFRCDSKTNAENEQIAHWLILLTDNHRTRDSAYVDSAYVSWLASTTVAAPHSTGLNVT